MAVLSAFWKHLPPAAVQMRRIALFLGLKPESEQAASKAPTSRDDALRELGVAGMPIVSGRPNDPMLDFLDLP